MLPEMRFEKLRLLQMRRLRRKQTARKYPHCADGLLTVTRMFNNKLNPADYQYRYSTSNSLMKGLVSNGGRADLQVMCAPI